MSTDKEYTQPASIGLILTVLTLQHSIFIKHVPSLTVWHRETQLEKQGRTAQKRDPPAAAWG